MDDRPNILIIGVDTLRADHLGCYGYPRRTSPNIDRLASEGVTFNSAFAPAIPTHPGWTTILTGAHPLHHGVITHMGDFKLSPEIRMIQEVLRRNGYVTAAVDNMYLKYGAYYDWFTRGFSVYMHPGGIPAPEAGLKVQAEAVTGMTMRWLREYDRSRSRPFFLFIHYWDPHSPYKPPQPFDSLFWNLEKPVEGEEDIDYVLSQYDGEIAYVDSEIGKLLQFMEDHGLTENLLTILVADHGENLKQCGSYLGHAGLYDVVTRVPLIIAYPGRIPEGSAIDRIVQHTDVAATIYDLLGLEAPPTVFGKSLLPLIDGDVDELYREIVLLENSQEKAYGLRTERWKLIVNLSRDMNGKPNGWVRLFDLKRDPMERVNLATHEKELVENLRMKLDSLYKRILGGRPDPLRQQPVGMKRIKFYSEAKTLIELYGLIKKDKD